MKKYSLKYFSIVMAASFCAYTSSAIQRTDEIQVVRYLYYQSGAQNQIGSYVATTIMPMCSGNAVLCAIRITDPNGDGEITQAEFSPKFAALDTNSNLTLNDEVEGGDLYKHN